MSTFPSALDTFTDPSSDDFLSSTSVPHASQHTDVNNAAENIQAKVGVDNSTVSTSIDYRLTNMTVPSVESLTSTNAGDTLSATAASFINSSSTVGSNVYVLPDPPAVGTMKHIFVEVGTTDTVDLVLSSTASAFFGTTFNGIRVSTGANQGFTVLGQTTSVWGVTQPTNVTLIATTVTTG